MMKRRPPEVKREARDDAARGDARHAGAGAAPDDPRGAARRDPSPGSVSYTHLRAHETLLDLV
ncbi:hypothetical protein J4758_30125, partial [Burkholderia pseudomallei]|nr:hypothetical protein [Burkholderia pseudomallei]